MKRIHLQPGLGDAVHALPFVIELADVHGGIELFTHYSEIFNVAHGVITLKTPVPYRLGDIRFQWSRVGRKTFAEKYEIDSGVKGNNERARYALTFMPSDPLVMLFARAKKSGKKLCVLGEPRAAARHKAKGDFSCSASPYSFGYWAESKRSEYYFVSAGSNEVFADKQRVSFDEDLNDKLSLTEFITLIRCADAVASQESCFTVLASLFRVPMKVFKAAGQTEEQHLEHVRRCTFSDSVFIE